MSFARTLKSVLSKLISPESAPERPLEQASPPSELSGEWLTDGYSWIPDWQKILGDDWPLFCDRVQRAKGGPKVLIATMVGGNSLLTPMETLFAVALTLRGAEVHFVLCDKKLPACQNCFATDTAKQESFVKNGPDACDWCFDVGSRSLSQLGLTVHSLGSLIRDEDWPRAQSIVENLTIEEILSFQLDGVDHTETVKAAVLRYFGRSDLENEPLSLPVAKRYLLSSLITTWALQRLYEQEQFEHIVSNQGIYVPQGGVVAVAKNQNRHVVAWDVGYRTNCFNVCHSETHIHSYMNEPTECWESLPWNDRMEERISKYLSGRWSGRFDWLKVITQGENTEPADIAKEIGLDLSKPVVGLLTNVLWDGQLCYPSNAFESQIDWIKYTIRYFEGREDIQLLIRIHPSEHDSWIKSRQSVSDEIKKHFPRLPKNVFVILATSTINTYKAMLNCNAVLIYGTTAGLEMVCMGLPVIAAGEAWIRSKGLCAAVSTPQEYKTVLDDLPFKMKVADDVRKRALKYAYHFYLRQMIPLGIIETQPFRNALYKIPEQPLKSFDVGSDLGLDVICDGILSKLPFVYPMETLDTETSLLV